MLAALQMQAPEFYHCQLERLAYISILDSDIGSVAFSTEL